MADAIFLEAKENMLIRDAGSGIDWDADDMWVLLVTAIPSGANLDAWDFRDDVTNEVAAGSGYSAGGMDLGAVTVAKDTTNDRVTVDFPDSTWASATFTAAGAIVYKKTGGAASTDPIFGVWDFGGSKVGGGGNFTIQWSSSPACLFYLV